MSTSRLWAQLDAQERAVALQCPYVVCLHNFYELAANRAVFRFEHPNREKPVIDNTRRKRLSFVSELAATLHGFSGYFESELYPGVLMSIRCGFQTNTHALVHTRSNTNTYSCMAIFFS